MSTEAQLKAISNTELASGTQIPALKHRTVNNAIIEEMYDSQSRGDVLSGVQSAVSLSGGDQVLVIRSGAAFLLDATEFGFVDALADLTDVNIPTPANDQVLSYNTSTGKWEAKDISALPGSVSLSGVYTLNRLTKITGVNTIGQTIVSDDGTTVNVGGNLSVDNNLTVGTINSGTSSDFVKGDGSLDSTDYQDQIDAEEAARIAADNTLQGNIDAEATARANADSNLQNNIDAEESARIADDSNLQSQVTTNASNITTNASNISTNASNIATNTSDISDNASDIITNANNISTNTSDIATNTSNISTNTSNIATNTSNIATNTSNIATNTSDIATNTSNIATNTSDITDLQNDKQDISEKNQANGYAPLDSGAKIPLANLPDSVLGQVTYEGTWNASTNTPTLANPPASTTKGEYYVSSDDGTQFGIDFKTGDWIISNGSAWEKVDNTDAVTSVFGRLGNVVANAADYASFYPPNSRTISAGTGLSGGGDLSANRTISHADTSSQGSVDNSGLTFIQDVTLDGFGHVTGLGSATVTLPTVNNDTITLSAGTGLSGGGAFTLNQSSAETITFNNTDRGSSQSIFKNVAVGGQSTIVADSNNDTLTFAAGSNITITTNASTDTITINSSFTDTNNFVNSASFNTGNGVLTLGRSGLSDVTVDLDGRYATSASLANVAYTDVDNNFSTSQTINSGATNVGLNLISSDQYSNIYFQDSLGNGTLAYNGSSDVFNFANVTGITVNNNQVLTDADNVAYTDVNNNFDVSQTVNGQITSIGSGGVQLLLESTSGGPNQAFNNSTGEALEIATSGTGRAFFRSDFNSIQSTAGMEFSVQANDYLVLANSLATFEVNTTINGNLNVGEIFTLGLNSTAPRLNITRSAEGANAVFAFQPAGSNASTASILLGSNTTINGNLTAINKVVTGNLEMSNALPSITMTDTDTNGFGRIRASNGDILIEADEGNTQAGSNIRFEVDTVERMRINSSGNVGIGESTPLVPLHISKNTASGENIALILDNNDSTANAEVGLLFRAATGGQNTDFQIATINKSANAADLVFRSDGVTERMRIDSSGNVGIGTSNPQEKLEVSGTILIDTISSATNAGLEISTANNRKGRILFNDSDASSQGRLVYDHLNDSMEFFTAGSERMRIDSSGNVSINSGNLSVTGSISATGNVSAYSTSDIRFKDIIGSISSPLERLSRLGGYEFTWNKDIHSATKGQRDIGVVAQEVEAEFPELVRDNPEGIKQVDYAKLTAVLIEAVKELNEKIERLENNGGN